ncbi:MAG: corrinoid protein [Oscillospiraceae bacterium]|nr:corrinoid protein [Oscillospiraceae bacterium]
MANFEDIAILVEKGRARDIAAAVDAAMSEGVSAEDILNLGLLSGMEKVSESFRANKIFVPEVMLAARTMTIALEKIRPLLVGESAKPCGKVVICTVDGDRHDIGKNLVKMMLEGAGFEVTDLGVSVSADKVVSAVREKAPDIVALSALLTTTMKNQETVIEALTAAGLRESVKVIVGGAPVTEEFARSIGADGYAKDASEAAALAKSFIA